MNKCKHIFLNCWSFIFLLFTLPSFAQFEYVSATIKNGSQPNTIKIVLKSNTDFVARFTNLQFVVQLPNTQSIQPNLQVENNLMQGYFNANYVSQVTNEVGYYNYLFSAIINGSEPFHFVAGQEYDALEIAINGGLPNAWYEARLGHLSHGGNSYQAALYIEMGADYTNYTNAFYGEDANNGGGYGAFSFVPLHYNTIDIRLLSFDLMKKKEGIELSWTFDDPGQSLDTVEIEKSYDGFNFNLIKQFGPPDQVSNKKYIDTDPSPLIYYRLKWKNQNRNIRYSEIKLYRKENKPDLPIFIYPNPASQTLNFSFEWKTQEKLDIEIYDINGKRMKQLSWMARSGLNYGSFFIDQLPASTYILSIKNGKDIQYAKFIKLSRTD